MDTWRRWMERTKEVERGERGILLQGVGEVLGSRSPDLVHCARVRRRAVARARSRRPTAAALLTRARGWRRTDTWRRRGERTAEVERGRAFLQFLHRPFHILRCKTADTVNSNALGPSAWVRAHTLYWMHLPRFAC